MGQVIGLTKTAMKVYNCTNPIQAIRVMLTSVVKDCSSPQIQYPIKWKVLLIQLVIVVANGGNTLSVVLSLSMIRQIVDAN